MILASCALFGGPRGPVGDQPPLGAGFNGWLDVLLIDVIADDGDISNAVVRRVFRGPERAGPITVEWDIVQSDPPAQGGEAHQGDRLIITGVMTANRFFVRDAYRDSERAEADLAENLPPAEHPKPLQEASFLFLLATPLLQVGLHFLGKRDRRFIKVNLMLPILALLDYLYYNSDPALRYEKLRLDLLLLIPLCALIALLWVIFAVKALNSRRDEPRPELR